MDKKDTNNPADLNGFRTQIDEIDDKLIQLLQQRTGIVQKIGALKHKTSPGQCPIRPGREADMLRRVIEKFSGSPFSPAAAAAMWRTLIGASTTSESPLTIAVFTPDKDESLYWLAREYFGSFLPITRHPLVKRVIGDVMDGTASVGIVPLLRQVDTSYWWTNLVQQGKDMPKIFAQVPFVNLDASGNAPAGFAIARIAPEASSDDISLIVIEADHNVSQSRLQALFKQANLEANWINIASLAASARHHLISIKGFVSPDQEPLKSLLAGLGKDVLHTAFLGAYGTPVTLKTTANKQVPHASTTANA